MWELQYFLNNLWKWKCGMEEEEQNKKRLPDLEEIRKTQRNVEFEELCHNRMVMGAFRYGLITTDESKNYNHLSSVRKRLDMYEQTGNLEYLLDISNLCMLEYTHSKNKGNKVIAIDDNKFHSKKY